MPLPLGKGTAAIRNTPANSPAIAAHMPTVRMRPAPHTARPASPQVNGLIHGLARRRIQRSRLALWPLERRERWILRLASPWINPLTWGLAGLAVWGAGRIVTVGMWAAVAGLFAAVFLLTAVP